MDKRKKKTKPIENEQNCVTGLEDFTGPDEPNGVASAQIYPSNELEDGLRPRMTTADLAGEEYSRYPAKNTQDGGRTPVVE